MPPLSKIPPSKEWFSVRHTKVDQPEGVLHRRVTREAFDEVWSDLGWVEIPGTSSEDPEPVAVAEETAAKSPAASTVKGA